MNKDYVLKVLQLAGTKSKAAKILGIDRKTLHGWLEKWGVSRQWIRPPAPSPPPSA